MIGIGAGDPAWLTLEAARALEALDAAIVFVKGADDELAAARRALLPASVRELTAQGHEVFVETQAAERIGVSDEDYAA